MTAGLRTALGVTVSLLLALSCACARRDGAWHPRYVVLVAVDTCRADHLGCYGYGRPTSPNIDRLAAGGVVFENAFSQSNESLFSYSSLFTSRYPRDLHPLSHTGYLMPRDQATLASLLTSYGVKTAAFVAGGQLAANFGLDKGFGVYEWRWHFGSLYHTMPPALDWLAEQAAGHQPAFLFVQGYDAHDPYRKPMFFTRLYAPDYRGVAWEIAEERGAISRIYDNRWFADIASRELKRATLQTVDNVDPIFMLKGLAARGQPATPLREDDVRALVAAYDGAISYADIWIGLLMARLRALGIEDETLVIVLGDHGEELMEQGYFSHRVSLHDSSLHVPLVMWGGGVRPRRESAVVELLDVAPTVLDMMGLRPPPDMRGVSLERLLQGGTRPAVAALSEGILPPLSLRDDRYRLVYNGERLADPDPRASFEQAPFDARSFGLFDVKADPAARVNLMGDPAKAAIARALREELARRLAGASPETPAPHEGQRAP